MSPFHGPLYNILDIRNSVHITHLGVTVKLHPLLGTVVHTHRPEIGRLLNSDDRTDGQITVKFINGGNALDLNEFSC